MTGSIDIKGFNDNILTVGTRKTGKVVHIPINKIAKEIWDKYKGKLPKSYPSKIIDIVQDVAKEVGINQEVLFTRTEGGKMVKEYFKKYELIGMHTARRSFATNAYKSGVPHQTIMNLTSHKTYESFIRYLRLGGAEHAEIAQKNEFFK